MYVGKAIRRTNEYGQRRWVWIIYNDSGNKGTVVESGWSYATATTARSAMQRFWSRCHAQTVLEDVSQ